MLKPQLAAALLLILGASLARADIDWRTKGVVTPVGDQGQLCASWAFAVTGVVEGAAAVQGGTLHNLSEQQLIDCSECAEPAADGCTCPQVGCAFDYARTTALCSDASYPYTAAVGSCQTTCTPVVASGFASNWNRLSGETGLVIGLNQGPVLARLEVGDQGQTLQSYLDYQSGVFAPASSDSTVVQWVLLVGYTANYFIVKNSLGTSWGMNGYMLLQRGANRLGVDNFGYALQGPTGAGACTVADAACMEMTAGDCSAAGGSFAGVDTFCAAECDPLPTPTSTETSTTTPTVTPAANGAACTSSTQCQSAFCVDDVCCGTACTEPLMQCNLRGQAGTCATTAAAAPALTPHALLAALAVLGALAAFALRRQRS